ncbi:MAG: potassium channel family protein [Proteobacteria bacterium]|nr:potassium channel family protein [Pseudomonadota bacterium]
MLKIVIIFTLAVVLAIGLHYTALLSITRLLERFHGTHPASIVLALFLAVFAHLFEILIFAVAWQILFTMELITFSIEAPDFIDLIYFSGTTYTTIGYGDIILTGNGRIMAVVEGVMGLVLIAWTASFTYYEMNRKWIKNV